MYPVDSNTCGNEAVASPDNGDKHIKTMGYPAPPKPILDSEPEQSFCWLLTMPILTLESLLLFDIALKPSLLQFRCKEACAPISVFHVLRPSMVLR